MLLVYIKKCKSHIRAINLDYQFQPRMRNLTYLIDNIPYQIFRNILSM